MVRKFSINLERNIDIYVFCTRLFFYKKDDFKKHEAEITGPVDC